MGDWYERAQTTYLIDPGYVSAHKTETLCWITALRWHMADDYNKTVLVL